MEKSVQKQQYEIEKDEGIVTFLASTPSKDADGDIVEQNWEFRNHIPLLWAHSKEAEEPLAIGQVIETEVSNDRLIVKADIDLQDRLGLKVWKKLKRGDLAQTSVGFEPLKEPERIEDGRYRFPHNELYEVSIVNVGSNKDTGVLQMKSITKEGRRNRSEDKQAMGHVEQIMKYLKGDIQKDSIKACPFHSSEKSSEKEPKPEPEEMEEPEGDSQNESEEKEETTDLSIGEFLEDVIYVSRRDEREAVVGEVVEASGKDESTVRQVLNDEIECPDMSILEAFAESLSASGFSMEVDALLDVLSDSCDYSEDGDEQDEQDEMEMEQEEGQREDSSQGSGQGEESSQGSENLSEKTISVYIPEESIEDYEF
jgi:HK97 family phage prohead protease